MNPAVARAQPAAHFEDAGGTVRMTTFAHTFDEYKTAFRAAGLREVARRDWRPVDFGDAATRKMCKRGAEFPPPRGTGRLWKSRDQRRRRGVAASTQQPPRAMTAAMTRKPTAWPPVASRT